jgi:elongation factor P--(R)-beta-lysine ligase
MSGSSGGVQGASAAQWRPSASLDALRLRARLNAAVRAFFSDRDVLEVETPILSAAGNTDPNIASFAVAYRGPGRGASAVRWLRTSPEFFHKRLLASGVGDCYELGRVFRDGEAGVRHNPEFTLLEWYRVGWDHLRLIDETVELVCMALALVGRQSGVRRTTFRELYREQLGLDPFIASDAELQAALGTGAPDPAGLTRDDWLDLLMTHRLQPMFPAGQLLVVHDYPASQCALARVRDGLPPVAERFELYLGALELANGYHELADAGEQRARFECDLARRAAHAGSAPAVDEHLLDALVHGLPDCAGVALGLDRLLLAMLQGDAIAETLAFDFSRA